MILFFTLSCTLNISIENEKTNVETTIDFSKLLTKLTKIK